MECYCCYYSCRGHGQECHAAPLGRFGYRPDQAQEAASRQVQRLLCPAPGRPGGDGGLRRRAPLGACLDGAGSPGGAVAGAQVRAFVRGNKDDAADARAIWLAAQQSDIRRVPLKSCAQQAMLSLHRVRQHWVDVRTATINALRGPLYEFGVALPVGKEAGLKALAERRALIEQTLPAAMSRLIDAQLLALKQLEQHVKVFEAGPSWPLYRSAMRRPSGCARCRASV
jgi:hypothetical protein